MKRNQIEETKVERSDCPIHGNDMMRLAFETPAAKYYRCDKCNLLKGVDKKLPKWLEARVP